MNNKIFISGNMGATGWGPNFHNAEQRCGSARMFDRYGDAGLSYKYGGFGFDVVSPRVFLKDKKTGRTCTPTGLCRRMRSYARLLRCSYVFFVRGWHEDPQSRREHRLAEFLGKRIIYEEDMR